MFLYKRKRNIYVLCKRFLRLYKQKRSSAFDEIGIFFFYFRLRKRHGTWFISSVPCFVSFRYKSSLSLISSLTSITRRFIVALHTLMRTARVCIRARARVRRANDVMSLPRARTTSHTIATRRLCQDDDPAFYSSENNECLVLSHAILRPYRLNKGSCSRVFCCDISSVTMNDATTRRRPLSPCNSSLIASTFPFDLTFLPTVCEWDLLCLFLLKTILFVVLTTTAGCLTRRTSECKNVLSTAMVNYKNSVWAR